MDNDSYSIKKRSVWSFVGSVALAGFIYLQAVGYLIPGFVEIYKLKKGGDVDVSKIGLMWVPIISYLLVSLWVCLTVNIFKKLKTLKQRGLVVSLVGSLVWGLVVGLVGGLVVGLFVGLSLGLFVGLYGGLSGEFL